MNKLFAFAAASLIVLSASAYTERNLIASRANKAELKEMLVTDQKWVNLPAYSDRAAWDSLLGDNKEYYIKRGEKALSHDWPRVKATDYLEYERSGNRKIMEDPLDANNKAVADLLLAELAEGKGRFIDQLINGVYAASEMTSWALSAHIPAIKPGRSIQPYDKPVIDLVAGDMGNLYSWVYYFMQPEFDKINPEISRRLRHELKTRVLDPYLEYDKWWWDGSRNYNGRMLNNWNPWCLSNVLMTAMLMEDDKDRYTDIVYYTMLGVDKFLNYIKGDGACEEGPSYWGHAAGKTLDYVDMLSLATGGKLDMSNEKLIKDMGEYIARSYVGDGWVVNFADASARGGGDPYLVYRYGKAVDSDLLKSFAALMLKDDKAPQNGRDIYRTFAAFEIAPELKEYKAEFKRPAYTWYPETEFCYISTPQNLFFATKGGFNDESHNHNDAGTFSVWADNYPIIIDAGVGTYTRQTFSKERYSIWTMQSGWHNLPVINGFEQPHGRKFKAKDVKAGKNSIELNLTDAYPAEAGINNWTRAYNVKGREVKVTDKFDIKEVNTPNVVNFLSWGDIDASKPGVVKINANGHKATLTYDASRFNATVTDKDLPDTRLSNVWGPKISRISLTDKNPTKKGTYTYTIKAEK
ncbi:MAG: heparinase II/III-family protein [Paramuribaculum sp.]|nr:heparinase II/III-family protein [Paramuribaculum sp.]